MANAKSFCGHCGGAASQTCSECSNISYCSDECQQADLRVHKLLCTQFADFKDRPTPDVRRAIFLPPDGTNPKFIWAEVDLDEGGDDSDSDVEVEHDEDHGLPDSDMERGSCSSDFEGMFDSFPTDLALVVGKIGSGQCLDHSIHLRHEDYFMHYPPSACLNHLTGDDLGSSFKGPLVFCAMTKVVDSRFIVDMDTSSFTIALDALTDRKLRQGLQYLYFCRPEPQKFVEGVKYLTEKGSFEDVKVPVRHPIFASGIASKISNKFDQPYLTWQPQTPPASSNTDSDNNIPATAYLHMNINPTAGKRFGTIPSEWRNSKSTVLIVRKDKAPSPLEEVEKACTFFRKEVFPMLSGKLRKSAGAEAVADTIAGPQWRKVFNQRMKGKKSETQGKDGPALRYEDSDDDEDDTDDDDSEDGYNSDGEIERMEHRSDAQERFYRHGFVWIRRPTAEI